MSFDHVADIETRAFLKGNAPESLDAIGRELDKACAAWREDEQNPDVPFNVLSDREACLDAAETALGLRDREEAHRHLRDFWSV